MMKSQLVFHAILISSLFYTSTYTSKLAERRHKKLSLNISDNVQTDADYEYRSCLIPAIQMRDVYYITQFCDKYPGHIDKQDLKGYTPLMRALLDLHSFNVLLRYPQNLELHEKQYGFTALALAAHRLDEKNTKHLIDAGANVFTKDHAGHYITDHIHQQSNTRNQDIAMKRIKFMLLRHMLSQKLFGKPATH